MLTFEERKRLVMNRIGVEPVHIDKLEELTGLPPYEISAALVCLELEERVRQMHGKRFRMVTQADRDRMAHIRSAEFNRSYKRRRHIR